MTRAVSLRTTAAPPRQHIERMLATHRRRLKRNRQTYRRKRFGGLAAAALLSIACAQAGPRASRVPVASVMTGLWDAHTHLSYYGEAALDSLLAYGVVAVRDCGGDAVELRRWRDEIAAGKRRGPRIYFSGPVIDGPKNAPYRLTVTTPEQAQNAVDSLASLGVDFIKTHDALSRAAYFAVLREAKRRGLKVASHLPRGVPAWEAADSGASSIEHAAESMAASPIYAGYATDVDGAVAWWRSPAGDSAIAHLARTGVAFTPTLVAYRASALSEKTPDMRAARLRLLEFLKELTGRMQRAGVPILAGSDFSIPEGPLVPSWSLREELELLVESGLTRQQALAAATTTPQGWFKR